MHSRFTVCLGSRRGTEIRNGNALMKTGLYFEQKSPQICRMSQISIRKRCEKTGVLTVIGKLQEENERFQIMHQTLQNHPLAWFSRMILKKFFISISVVREVQCYYIHVLCTELKHSPLVSCTISLKPLKKLSLSWL